MSEQRALARVESDAPTAPGLPFEQDTLRVAKAMAASGFFKDTAGVAQAVVKILAGRELGFGPVAAMTGVYIVEGKVTLSANLMAAAIKRSGRYTYRVRELSNEACRIEFFERSESVGVSEFTMADARLAKLAGKNTWQSYPRNLLFARAMSNGARFFCADVFGGPIYTPEELGAPVDADGEVIGRPALAVVTPIADAPEPEPASRAPAIAASFDAALAEADALLADGDLGEDGWVGDQGNTTTAFEQEQQPAASGELPGPRWGESALGRQVSAMVDALLGLPEGDPRRRFVLPANAASDEDVRQWLGSKKRLLESAKAQR